MMAVYNQTREADATEVPVVLAFNLEALINNFQFIITIEVIFNSVIKFLNQLKATNNE